MLGNFKMTNGIFGVNCEVQWMSRSIVRLSGPVKRLVEDRIREVGLFVL